MVILVFLILVFLTIISSAISPFRDNFCFTCRVSICTLCCFCLYTSFLTTREIRGDCGIVYDKNAEFIDTESLSTKYQCTGSMETEGQEVKWNLHKCK